MHLTQAVVSSVLFLSMSSTAVEATRIRIAVDAVEVNSNHHRPNPLVGDGTGQVQVNDFKTCYNDMYQVGYAFVNATKHATAFVQGEIKDQRTLIGDMENLLAKHGKARATCSHLPLEDFDAETYYGGLKYFVVDLKCYADAISPARCKLSRRIRESMQFEIRLVTYEWDLWGQILKEHCANYPKFIEEHEKVTAGWEALASYLRDTSECKKSRSNQNQVSLEI